jgi:uncharacterized protein (TIGR01777 family)
MSNAKHSGKIVIPGGAGYLGTVLVDYYTQRNYKVVVLSRKPHHSRNLLRYAQWDGVTLGDWAEELEDATAVINLSGRSVNCRYTPENKQEIYDSRLLSTKVLGEAIAKCTQPPPVWINSSSATIYRDSIDEPMDDETGELGEGFSVDVCQKWEKALEDACTPRTRKVAARTAMVFGYNSEVAKTFKKLVKFGLGGKQGSGKQYMSWIHEVDFASSIQWIVRHDELNGSVNIASPNPVTNAEFMQTLRSVCNMPIGLPATPWMLEIGAQVLNTETELLLKSRRVVPKRLLDSGFRFRFPQLRGALESIIQS